MGNKLFSLLGIAQRSGNLISGEDTCERYIKKNAVYLVIVATDASNNTTKKFRDMTHYRGINFIAFGDKNSLSQAIGKTNRSVLAIKDEVFATKIFSMIVEEKDGLNNSGGE